MTRAPVSPIQLVSDAISHARRRWVEYGLVLVFFTVWTAVATYPLVLRASDTIENWGDPLLNVWIIAWDLHQLSRQPLQLFDAPIFYPAHNTLALSEILIVQALEALPIVLVTHNVILAYNLIVLSSYALAGFGAYLLIRQALPPSASLVGGAVYAFSFYRVGESSHLQILSAQWVPFAILALITLRHTKRWRDAGILAGCIVLQVLSSFYLGLFLAATLVFLVVWLDVVERQRPERRLVLRLFAVAALTGLAVLPFSLPYFQVVRDFGLIRSLGDAIGGSATIRNYLAVPPTSLLYGRNAWPVLQQFATDETLFPGILSLGLGAIGLALGRRRTWSGFFLGLTVFGIIFSLGPRYRLNPDNLSGIPLPYALLYSYVPGFQSIRVVGRMGVIATLGVAGLTALGAASILGRLRGTWRPVVGAGIALLVVGESLAIPTRTTPVETTANVPPVDQWLAARSDNAPALELPTIESRWLAVPAELERQGHEQYLSIFHWHPTPSGYSGFEPPLFWSVIREAKAFPTVESVNFLQGLGVRYLIFHQSQYDPGRWQQIVGRLGQFSDVLQPLATFGTDSVYRLADSALAESAPTPWISLPSAIVAGESYRGILIWPNPGQSERLTHPAGLAIRATWTGRSGTTSSIVSVNEPTYLPRGDTPTRFDLEPPSQSGRYTLTIDAGVASTSQSVNVIRPTSEPPSKDTTPTMLFVDATIGNPIVSPGGVVFVGATWQVRHQTVDNYLFHTEIVNSHGDVAIGTTVDPFNGELETGRWVPGSFVRISQSVILPEKLGADTFTVRLRVHFADDVDAKLVDSTGNVRDWVNVGTIVVRWSLTSRAPSIGGRPEG